MFFLIVELQFLFVKSFLRLHTVNLRASRGGSSECHPCEHTAGPGQRHLCRHRHQGGVNAGDECPCSHQRHTAKFGFD